MALDDWIDQHAIFQEQRESELTHLDERGFSSAAISNCNRRRYRAVIGTTRVNWEDPWRTMG